MSEVAIESKVSSTWEVIPLRDILKTKKGKKPKDLSENKTKKRDIPYIDIKAFESKIIRKYCTNEKIVLCDENDVLIVWDGSRSGLVGIGAKGAVGSTIAKIEAPLIDSKYLYYFLLSKFTYLNTNTRGVGIPHVDPEIFNNLDLPLAPVEQQKIIVAKIEELFSHIDAGIESLKKAKKLLKQYRQSVLKAAVTGELTKEWREQNKDKLEPASQLLERIEKYRDDWIERQVEEGASEAKRLKNKLKKHDFNEIEKEFIPDDWVSVSLLKLCLAVVDCHNKTAPYVDEGIPLIRTTNIRHGVINFERKMKYITEETYDYWSRRCPPQAGDILLTREAPMGESAIVPSNIKLCMGQRMMLLRPIHELTDVQYLHLALMEPLFQSRFQDFKVGVGVQHLRVGDVEKSVVAMPSLEEQKEIVRIAMEKLDSINRLEADIEVQLKKANKNKQSILATAFSGNLI